MSKKNIMVVGASSGVGLEISKLLAQEMHRIILVSSNEDKLTRAMQQLEGTNHCKIVCDLSKPETVKNVFDELVEEKIILDGMVYCAGIAPLCLLKDNEVELMKEVFSINVLSFIEMSKFFYKDEISRRGSRIVAVSSVTAHGAGYRQTLYGASKAALVSAVKLMAKELLNRDIRVNCISPGVINTPMLDILREKSENLDEKIKVSQPLGIIPCRVVAENIKYYLEGGADYCTGVEVSLDAGGYLK